VESAQKRLAIDNESTRRLAETILRAEGRTDLDLELGIIFVDDPFIIDLNAKYAGTETVTDVLAFSLQDDDNGGCSWNTLGEIYISVDRAVVQAREYSVSLAEEMARLVIHGLLHLLGYDHKQDRDRVQMKSKEARYLELMRELNIQPLATM
jgi:probable rRNA maturation factor